MTKDNTTTEQVEYPLENKEQARAFRLYVKQPARKKDLKEIGAILGMSPTTIRNWQHKFKWTERLKAVQKQARIVGEEMVGEYVLGEMRELSAMKAYGIQRALEKMKTSILDLTMTDIQKFVHIIKVEMGEPITIQAAIPTVPDGGVFDQLLALRLNGLSEAQPQKN